MEKGNTITFERRTFKFGNSKSAITIPSAFAIPIKATLRVTIEMIDDGKASSSGGTTHSN